MIMAHDPWYTNWDVNIYGHWRHAGIYQQVSYNDSTSSREKGRIIDAHPDRGVAATKWEFWQYEYKKLGAFGVPSLFTGSTPIRRTIADKAASYIGKPYLISTNKSSEDSFYCSKLIWLAFKFKNIDLDSNEGLYVLPDDIVNKNDLVKSWKTSEL